MDRTKRFKTNPAVPYQAPLLRIYGSIQQLTTGGTGAVMETNTMCQGMNTSRQMC
jgi:hypothetical protein